MVNEMDTSYALKLYVFGQTGKSESAIRTVKRICSNFLAVKCSLEVVDIADNPELGFQDCILATPTLIRQKPAPECRIIGDLSQTAEVVAALTIPDE